METAVLKTFENWHQQVSKNLENEGFIINYYGYFDEMFVHGLIDVIEERLIALKFPYSVAQRVFASVSEAILNINSYAISDVTRLGSLFVYIQENKIKVKISNIVKNQNRDRLIDRLVNTNELEREALEERYLDLKRRSIVSNSSGFGIGLIFIRMCSSVPISFHFEEHNEEFSIFSLKYEITEHKKGEVANAKMKRKT